MFKYAESNHEATVTVAPAKIIVTKVELLKVEIEFNASVDLSNTVQRFVILRLNDTG